MERDSIRNVLIEIQNKNLLNLFANIVFGYDFKDNDYVYMQYKTLYDNVVINIFDNNNDNRFNAYIFTNSDDNYSIYNDDEKKITYVNINNCYKDYKNNVFNNLSLFASLMKTDNKKERTDIINQLFSKNIKDIFLNFI